MAQETSACDISTQLYSDRSCQGTVRTTVELLGILSILSIFSVFFQ